MNIVETAVKDVEKVAVAAVHIAEGTIKVVDNAKALAPEFKTELSLLLSDAETITNLLGPVLSGGYVGIFTDLNKIQPAIAAITKLVRDVTSFVPTLEAALAQLEANLSQIESGTTVTTK